MGFRADLFSIRKPLLEVTFAGDGLLARFNQVFSETMGSLKRALTGALGRNAPAISFIILAFLIVTVLSTAYFLLAFNREQFLNLPQVKEYDNLLENVTGMDEWSRTKFYWSNNLRIAGLYAISFPFYTGAASLLMTSHQIGLAAVYNYHLYGPLVLLNFISIIFVHGIFELTGALILGGASLRLAWKLWGYLGHALTAGWGKVTRKRRTAIRQHLIDYLILIALASLLIALAAPVEAYLSPSASVLFLISPTLAILFLASVLLFYAAIIRVGFRPMLRRASSVLEDLGELASGRWKPSHLSLLMFLLFSLLTWLGLLV